ncbi:hypothetical protein BOSE62_40043 [Bosea sp. 62]|nr:hypothetical protein BOSE46_120746 [Bosea sp. 46]CAD5265001.1 hypothetical protein BOSE21B_110983 [Bosea sp. 21B]CAD5275324.1 hypothetical protein BOSE7B_40232 [Bosea sp. 7B]VVT59164.1 hypothetical protein BOS5A_201031 [Bosea sp. EC-HK365B]VXB71925.1 hypothetical protein BOSE29B_120057 [Bosea sp. 29B]VXC11552.1 hypothetical protein BOSE125_170052 [Bosea sp. 125]VXC29995.1 hypothetical protein BOSE62_40043 [Bosea sp. 62]VXC75325.1 hypothetical protein BOSE127_40408 [Bosea sp. 127]
MGLCQGRHPGLLPPGEADRQRLHRSVQRPFPQRVPEHALVPDACGCDGKDGGLAQLLQRGSAARGHRQQATDPAAKSRRDTQPAAVTKGRKLQPPTIQKMGSDHPYIAVPRKSLDAFAAKYASLYQLSQGLGKNLPTLKRDLARRGVEPVWPPNRAGASFYLRSAIPPSI